METTAQKQWEKPTLIILVRGKPEEAVLTACKLEVAGSIGAIHASLVHGCSDRLDGNCSNCQSRGGAVS